MRSLEEASRCEICRNFDHEAINFDSVTTSRSPSFEVLNNASCLINLLLRRSEKSIHEWDLLRIHDALGLVAKAARKPQIASASSRSANV